METLLEGQDKLTLIRLQMEGWTDNALKVFQRHRKDPTRNHPDQERMVKLNQVSLSCGNDPVVKNSIYSNGDFDL
jgi:hypothetical protein